MTSNLHTHITTLKRRNTRGQIFAGLGLGICMTLMMAIVLGGIG